MIDGIPKISILIICYKQEILIRRAIDSLLRQKDYIYEICVSDDCSPDGTWEVLKQYSNKNPGLFKLHRNDPNVGIFENIEQSWKMPTGDIIYQLSGDDECGEEWLKTVVEFIKDNKIDYKNQLFCIYGDYQAKYLSGDSFVMRNKAILSGYNPLGLALRKLICNRSTCFSKNVLDKYIKVSEGRSYSVESAQDMQLQIFSENNYYISHIGNIYHTGIGVSTGKNKVAPKLDPKTPMESLNYVIEYSGYSLPYKDIKLIKFYQQRAKWRNELILNPSKDTFINRLCKTFQLNIIRISSYEMKLGLMSRRAKRLLFAIARRLPHKRQLHWYI